MSFNLHLPNALLLSMASFSLILLSDQTYAFGFSPIDGAKLLGITGFAIIGLSLLGVAVVLERFVHLKRAHIAPDDLTNKINVLWGAGKHDEITRVCQENQSTLAKVYGYINKHKDHNVELISTGAGDIASIELRKHIEKAYPLAVVATIAPLAGLLGTVVGMIEAFYVVAATGALGDASILADGIYKALFTTALGLFVALPAMGFHHFFKSRITLFGLAIEEQVNEFISDHYTAKVAAKCV